MSEGNGPKFGIPLAVFVSAIIATASLTFGVQSTLIYGRDLTRLTTMVERQADRQQRVDVQIATLVAIQQNHITSGGHEALDERVRKLELMLSTQNN